MRVRDAVRDDMVRCCELYNALIATTTVAWTEEEQTLDERLTWFELQQHDDHPVLVAEHEGDVVGFAAYGSFRGSGKWPGYRHTVEHTIHVDERWWGRGVGRALLEELIRRAQVGDVHVMVGAVDGDNEDSIVFHQKLGFTEVARMPEVGRKFDRWLDLVLLQRTVGREGAGTGEQ